MVPYQLPIPEKRLAKIPKTYRHYTKTRAPISTGIMNAAILLARVASELTSNGVPPPPLLELAAVDPVAAAAFEVEDFEVDLLVADVERGVAVPEANRLATAAVCDVAAAGVIDELEAASVAEELGPGVVTCASAVEWSVSDDLGGTRTVLLTRTVVLYFFVEAIAVGCGPVAPPLPPLLSGSGGHSAVVPVPLKNIPMSVFGYALVPLHSVFMMSVILSSTATHFFEQGWTSSKSDSVQPLSGVL